MPKVAQVKKINAMHPLPLKVGLLIIVLFVSAIGVMTSSVAVHKTMQSVINARVDQELDLALGGWARQDSLFLGNRGGNTRPPTDFYVIKIFRDGSTVEYNDHDSAPDVNSLLVDGPKQTLISEDPADPTRWRAMAKSYNGVIIVVAKNTSEEAAILQRIAVAQLVIGIAHLAIIGMLAYFLIHRTLRPLRQVEDTAKAITSGDLDARVPLAPTHTEIGAVATSMNVMLERLQQLIVELQQKEEQMRRFVGDASHELRTPLTSVQGFAELYTSGATDNADMVVEKIQEESQRMRLLVEDLLALTRAEGARFDEGNVDLLELALTVANSLKAAYPGRSIEVRSDCQYLPVVRGDAARLHQVLTNLSVNALTHGGADAKVTIRLYDGDTHTMIDVIDDGNGMSEQDAEHIFERFYRADASRNRATGGSGLGLAIVKTLVEAHGGTVSVRSAVGQGTTFTVTLPGDVRK